MVVSSRFFICVDYVYSPSGLGNIARYNIPTIGVWDYLGLVYDSTGPYVKVKQIVSVFFLVIK